jgi:Glyoxalase/Bleomycin resistance protein/Dioxygenase superfamily.
MKLHHAAIWVTDLEKEKEYYVKHFGAKRINCTKIKPQDSEAIF